MAEAKFEAGTFWNELADAWNEQDPTRVLDAVAPHVEFRDPTLSTEGHGKDDYREWLGRWFSTMSDVTFEVKGTAREGSFLAALTRFRGTNTGSLRLGGQAIAATGQDVQMEVAEFFHLDDEDRIERHEIVFDALTLMRQLGVVPERTSASPMG